MRLRYEFRAAARASLGLVLGCLVSSGCASETEGELVMSFDSALEGADLSVEGTLQQVGVDTFDADGTAPADRKSRLEYVVQTDDGEDVHLTVGRSVSGRDHGHDHVGHLETGTRVRVNGKRRGRDLAIGTEDEIKVVSDGTKTSKSALVAAAPRKTAVILYKFSDQPAEPFTRDAARSVVFTGTSSSNAYYTEESFGKIGLTGALRGDGDVFGWVTINAANHATACDWTTWNTLANSAAAASGFVASSYQHIMYVFAGTTACGWSGVGYVPGRVTSVKASALTTSKVASHELGHNLSLHHARSTRCTGTGGVPVPISATCSDSEYGDPFDVMGGGRNHASAFNKARLGWFGAGNFATVTANGEFTLAPIETPTGALQAIRVALPGSTTSFYYLEYRRPYGFDNFLTTDPVANGVSIRIAGDVSRLGPTRLVDTTPTTTSFRDAPLTAGRTFRDGALSITTVYTNEREARVRVSLNGL